MKGKSLQWIARSGVCVIALALSMLLPADGQQAPNVPSSYNGAAAFPPRGPLPGTPPHAGNGTAGTTASPTGDPQEPANPEVAHAGDLIAFSSMLANGQQQIVVIDSSQHAIAVYRIQPESGETSLISVRNIRLDSSIDHFNSGAPSPEDIRKMQLNR